MKPQSKLTKYRPGLWAEALVLATGITGMVYVDKLPAADGAISCCGYTEWPREREERLEREREERERQQQEEDEKLKKLKDALHKEFPDHVIKRRSAPVPPGAVEWLLHEVGHYVAATESERLLPDYGLGTSLVGRDADREWAAWAFEEIVFAPFGPARLIAPPEHRSGVGFTRDRIPEWAMRRAHLGLIELDVDLAGLREMCGRWLRWAVRERQVGESGLRLALR